MKKLLTLLLVAAMAFGTIGFTSSCQGDEKIAALIALHGDTSSYDKNFIDAFKAACEAKGLTKK